MKPMRMLIVEYDGLLLETLADWFGTFQRCRIWATSHPEAALELLDRQTIDIVRRHPVSQTCSR